MIKPIEVQDMLPGKPYFSVDEVAKRLGVSPRWLADQCRDGVVEHVHIARKRRFTAAQVDKLLATHTIPSAAEQRANLARERAMRAARRERSR